MRELAGMASTDEIFSWSSPSARDYRKRRGDISDDELISLMLEEPRLIRRPILVMEGTVTLGYRKADYDRLSL